MTLKTQDWGFGECAMRVRHYWATSLHFISWCDKLDFTNKLTLFDSVTFTQVLNEMKSEKGYPDKFHPYINSSIACKGNQVKDMGQILKTLHNFCIMKSFWPPF